MKSDIDHQQFHSIFNKAAALLNHQNIEYPCELIDISLHGCLLRFKNTWELHNLESLYTLTLKLPDTAPIIMNLSISHAVDNEVSFKVSILIQLAPQHYSISLSLTLLTAHY